MWRCLLTLAVLLFAASAHADEGTAFTCQTDAGQKLDFTIDASVRTVTFTNIQAFGSAKMLANTPFGYDAEVFNKYGTILGITYDWGHIVEYNLQFDEILAKLKPDQTSAAKLRANSLDGSKFDDVRLTCQLAK